MRAYEFLIESTGLSNRKPGEIFKNSLGDELIFNSVDFYPEDQGNFETTQDRDEAKESLEKSLNVPPGGIIWSNNPSSTTLAFGIAHFNDSNGNDVYIGRYFQKVSPNKIENKFPNNLPGGFKLQSKTSKKESSGYKPTDVLSNLKNLKPSDIVSQIKSKFGEDSDEYRAIDIFTKATSMPIVIPKGNMNVDAFTNYFAEMLQPMALILNKPVEGNANEAESRFFGNQGFDTCTITFGPTKTAGLSDSILRNSQGKEILISSKSQAGAKASAKNLYEKFQEAPEMIKEYPEVSDILTTIVKGGYAHGLLNLAVQYKMINSKEKEQVINLRGLPASKQIVGAGLISKNLEKYYSQRKTKDPARIVPFYHMLASIAYPLSDYINKNTNFSQGASDILNHGALIQMHTISSVKGEDIIIKKFNTVYPSQAVTSVLLSAHKTYMSTDNKGNLTFLIKKN